MGRGTATPLGVVVEGFLRKTPPSVGLSADCHLPICASAKMGRSIAYRRASAASLWTISDAMISVTGSSCVTIPTD